MDHLYRVSHKGEAFYALERNGDLRRARPSGASIFDGFTEGDKIEGGLAAVGLLAPVAPSKIVCVGQNYLDHARELGKPVPAQPMIFIKPSTAVIGPGEPILLPPGVGRVDYEGELAVVIGRRAHGVRAADAWSCIFGLTCMNDVTARELQTRDVQYTRAKGFDTFAPIGPCIAIGASPGPRAVETMLNGAQRQRGDTAQMIFGIEALVEFVTFVMTLLPGDVISTGTPSGVGALADGDRVTIRVEGVGELTNPVSVEPAGPGTQHAAPSTQYPAASTQ
jgi:2-keto-4-pentenoate hydratase/2-oxohepta-3-ene-1,7-dioic acid hydratase in catechol pathway